MKTWAEAIGKTWLKQPDTVSALDAWVRMTLAKHRGTTPESVAPWSVDLLAKKIDALGLDNEWMLCLSAIAVLQELIMCALSGGIDPSGTTTNKDVLAANAPLRTLRNVVFHPALQNNLKGEPAAMLRFVEHLKADDDHVVLAVAERIEKDWSVLGVAPIGHYALRKLEDAVRTLLPKLNLDGPRDKARLSRRGATR